jgi:hypothetical protein
MKKKSCLHEINQQEEYPHGNMNFDLNISNQPLQHSKNSTTTSWGSPPPHLSPPAWSLPPPARSTLPASCAATLEIPRSPSRAATRASEDLLDGVGLLRCVRHLIVSGRVAPISNSAASSDREIRPSSFASKFRNTRSISSFVSAGVGVDGAEDDAGAFLGDGDDGVLPAAEEDG